MIPVHVVVQPNKVEARITIGESGFTLQTAEAEALMRRLIEARPMMLPAVEAEPAPPPTPKAIDVFLRHVDPNYVGGGAFLHLTHPALGWVTWHLHAHTARHLAFRLLEWTVPGIPPAPTP